MNDKTLLSLIIAMTLASGGYAFAQGNSDHRGRGRDEQIERRDRHPPPPPPHQRDKHWQARDDGRRDERGAGPNHDFHRGDRLPTHYRNSQYVVDDWRGYHLSAPPRGYHWVQTGGDYVLVAIASGLILQLWLTD